MKRTIYTTLAVAFMLGSLAACDRPANQNATGGGSSAGQGSSSGATGSGAGSAGSGSSTERKSPSGSTSPSSK